MTDDLPTWPQVICATRETRTDGTYECVRPPEHHDKSHVYVRLTVRPVGAA